MKHLQWLDGIRGILCVWVVLFHFTVRYCELYGGNFSPSFDNGGIVGVSFFFMITGYLTMQISKKYYELGWLKWLANKLIRLYPSYILACIISFLVIKIVGLEN